MVTLKEIAKKAKVSTGTVDRVFHNRGEVALKTQKKIQKILKELNYKPNVFARNLKLKKTYIFGVLMPKTNQDNRYWELPQKGIIRAQKELESQKVKVKLFYHDRASEKDFNTVTKKCLKEKPDGMLIAPTLFEQVEKFVKQLPPTFPYVFFDSEVPNTNYLSYIVQDSFQSGLVSGKLMKQILPDGGLIAVINILPKYYHIEERIRGFLSYFNKYLYYTLKTFYLDIRKEEAESDRLTESILEKNENARGIFVPCGHVSRFADFIYRKDLHGKINIIGYDLIETNKYFLQNGTIDYLISQRPETQGYQGIYSLYRYCVLKEKSQKEINLPIDIITKENMEYYW